MAPSTTSSWQARTHLAQRIHLLISLSIKGLASSIVAVWGILCSSRRPIPRSAAIWRSWQRLPLSHTRQESGWLASISLTIILRCSITLGDSVFITMPGSMGVTQEASNAPFCSFSTRQRRQAPIDERCGSLQIVGIVTPASRANSRIVISG